MPVQAGQGAPQHVRTVVRGVFLVVVVNGMIDKLALFHNLTQSHTCMHMYTVCVGMFFLFHLHMYLLHLLPSERVQNPAITVNRNQSVAPGNTVIIMITVNGR